MPKKGFGVILALMRLSMGIIAVETRRSACPKQPKRTNVADGLPLDVRMSNMRPCAFRRIYTTPLPHWQRKRSAPSTARWSNFSKRPWSLGRLKPKGSAAGHAARRQTLVQAFRHTFAVTKCLSHALATCSLRGLRVCPSTPPAAAIAGASPARSGPPRPHYVVAGLAREHQQPTAPPPLARATFPRYAGGGALRPGRATPRPGGGWCVFIHGFCSPKYFPRSE